MAARVAFSKSSLDVVHEADVAVCGGGPAGVAAAVAAARAGASVLLLEQIGCLGGMGTAGLVPCFCPYSDGEKPVVRGVGEEVLREMAGRMGFLLKYDWMPINPEILKLVYDDLVASSGAVIRLMARVADVVAGADRVDAAVVATKEGLKAVKARVFIDATGDGDVAVWAGAQFEVGDRGRTMAPSFCPMYTGIDWAAFDAECQAGPRPDQVIWTEQARAGKTPYKELYLPAGVVRNGPTTGSGNLTHLYGEICLDEESLTRATIDGRRMAWRILEWYRANVPGFENAEMAQTASLVGVRETRRILGDYVLCMDDYMKRASFDDDIGRLSYPVDIHSSTSSAEDQEKVYELFHGSALKKGESYGIPYRCLRMRGKENILVTGRSVSADRMVQSSLRVMPGCFVTGQGAGVAAALAARNGGDVRAVDTDELRGTLRSQGAYVP